MVLGVVTDLMSRVFQGFDLIPSHKAISVCIQKPFLTKSLQFRLIGFSNDIRHDEEATFDTVVGHDSGGDKIVFEPIVKTDRGGCSFNVSRIDSLNRFAVGDNIVGRRQPFQKIGERFFFVRLDEVQKNKLNRPMGMNFFELPAELTFESQRIERCFPRKPFPEGDAMVMVESDAGLNDLTRGTGKLIGKSVGLALVSSLNL